MAKIHFITYASDDSWIYALDRIAHEARKCGAFDSITRYTPAMLDPDFAARYAAVLEQPRGGGYWIWKPQIIRQKLDECEPGDAVVYADAGCRLNHKNTALLRRHLADLRQSPYGMLAAFEGDFGDLYMTNQAIGYFKETYGMDDGYKTECGVAGGGLIFLKSDHAYKILDEFERLLRADMMLITDAYNRLPQHPNFSGDCRHDQVIFTLLTRVFGCVRFVPRSWDSLDDFFIQARLRYITDIGGLLRVRGWRAPFYFALFLAAAAYRFTYESALNFRKHRLRGLREFIRVYRGRRYFYPSAFHFRLSKESGFKHLTRGALRKFKRPRV